MLCIALEANQKRVNGKIRFFAAGETFEFEKCPPNFEAIDNPPVDHEGDVEFGIMGEQWLRQYEGDCDKLAMFILETYKDAMIPANPTWNELVDILQHQKQVNVQMVDNTGKKENKLSSLEQTDTTITVTLNDVPPAAKVEKAKGSKKDKKAYVAPVIEKLADETKLDLTPDTDPALSKSVEDDLDDLFKNN